jgi:putative NIF3 family GTP cyclohydrolase 1 type 2
MTAAELVERIQKNLGIPWNQQTTRDTFKAGSPDTEIKGIATTFMATLDLLQRAHAAGMNLVITHEPTFWNDQDKVQDLAANPTYIFKAGFCAKN